MAAEETSGSTTTDGTEQTLFTSTTGKSYVLGLSLDALANGDEVEIRLKTKMRSGDSSQLAYYAVYRNAQEEPNVYSIPVAAPHELVGTITRTAGTDRAIEWSLITLD